MNPPDFWNQPTIHWRHLWLLPLAWLYDFGRWLRLKFSRPTLLPIPVICIGNINAGGTGKTPTALWLASLLKPTGKRIFFLSRGYGGKWDGPVMVDPKRHLAHEVGDEPLLLAKSCPTIIAKDRRKGAKMAIELGAELIIMDDGMQNPQLHKDLQLVVVDGAVGFGNCSVMPLGPLRQNLPSGLNQADVFIMIGNPKIELRQRLEATGKPILMAKFQTDQSLVKGKRLVAFCGIGRPSKFFETLKQAGANLVGEQAFPDHHPFNDTELEGVYAVASQKGAQLITTEKDATRLPSTWQMLVQILPVSLEVEGREMLVPLLRKLGLSPS